MLIISVICAISNEVDFSKSQHAVGSYHATKIALSAEQNKHAT